MIEEKKVRFEDKGILIEGTTYLIPPNPEMEYNCGYSIFVPKNCEVNTTLIMHSCNTGNNVPIHLDEANEIAKRSTYERVNPGMWFGNDLKMPVMIPLIPRVQGYYTQALGSKVLHNDVSTLIEDQNRREEEDKLSDLEIHRIQEQCRDLPTQVANMIKSAQLFLASIGITVDDKVIAEGYSAGSKFANCFTAYHPELVKACICGGNSGLGIIPLSEYKGQELLFPLGVADIPNFDYEAFSKIPQLYYIGTEDYNDPAMPKTKFKKDENGKYVLDKYGYRIPITDEKGDIIPILDSNGRIQPRYEENYTQHEIEQIHELLGKNPQVRFDNNEAIYKSLGINAIFKRFPGNHNSVTQRHDGNYFYTNECVKDFIRSVLNSEKQLDNSTGMHI